MTPEQAAAHRRLEDAIADVEAAFTPEGTDRGILVDWVLVTASHIDHGDHTATAHGCYHPPEQPTYRGLGLLDQQAHRLRRGLTG